MLFTDNKDSIFCGEKKKFIPQATKELWFADDFSKVMSQLGSLINFLLQQKKNKKNRGGGGGSGCYTLFWDKGL